MKIIGPKIQIIDKKARHRPKTCKPSSKDIQVIVPVMQDINTKIWNSSTKKMQAINEKHASHQSKNASQ